MLPHSQERANERELKGKEVRSFGAVTIKYGENGRVGELPAVLTWFCCLLGGSAACFSGLVLFSVAYRMMLLCFIFWYLCLDHTYGIVSV